MSLWKYTVCFSSNFFVLNITSIVLNNFFGKNYFDQYDDEKSWLDVFLPVSLFLFKKLIFLPRKFVIFFLGNRKKNINYHQQGDLSSKVQHYTCIVLVVGDNLNFNQYNFRVYVCTYMAKTKLSLSFITLDCCSILTWMQIADLKYVYIWCQENYNLVFHNNYCHEDSKFKKRFDSNAIILFYE